MTDTSPPTSAQLEPAASRAARQARQLARLAELGVELVEALTEDAKASPPADPAPLAMAFSRLTRAVRLCHALENHIVDQALNADREAPPPPYVRPPDSRSDLRRAVVRETVETMIDASADTLVRMRRENLKEDLSDLVDSELDDADIEGRSVFELVVLVCKDLGVEPDWSLWKPSQWEGDAALTPWEADPASTPGGKPKGPADHWPPPGSLFPPPHGPAAIEAPP